MCSIVLMAALTTGSATPGWHPCGGNCGSHGGYGGTYCGHFGGGYGGGYEGCGCWGGYSSWGYCNMPPPNPILTSMYPATGGSAIPRTGTGGEELDKPKSKKNLDKETMVPRSATVLVELPANAKLFVDDRPVQAAARVLTLTTPALEPGQDYFYMVRIERMRDGQPLSETRRILVRAGQIARADFKDLETEARTTVQAK